MGMHTINILYELRGRRIVEMKNKADMSLHKFQLWPLYHEEAEYSGRTLPLAEESY